MSVLEKIVQAEKDAQVLLASAQEKATTLLTDVNDDLATIKAENAQSIAKQINELVRKADNEISSISESYDVRKNEITSKIALSANTKKNIVVEKIFKDIVAWLYQ